jgi:hypothetical protein
MFPEAHGRHGDPPTITSNDPSIKLKPRSVLMKFGDAKI